MTKETVSLKSRKIHFDEYSYRYYFDSKSESVERKCREHEKHAHALNRGETKKMEGKHRQAENSLHLFDMKMDREYDETVDGMKDKISHSIVLQNIGRENENDPQWNDNLGKYGTGTSKTELLPYIDRHKKQLTAAFRRNRDAKLLLKQRKGMELMDRTADTDTLFKQWKKKKKSQSSHSRETPARLILPPIHASASMLSRPAGLTTNDFRNKSPEFSEDIHDEDKLGDLMESGFFVTNKTYH